MEKQHFSLEMRDDNMLTRIFKIILGILCLATDCYWLIFNLKAGNSGASVWGTEIFLLFFGSFIIWTGFGYGKRFLEFSVDKITLKKNIFLSPVVLRPSEIEKIELYPLKFHIKVINSKTILTRLGTSDIEKLDLIKEAILGFAEEHGIANEIRNEIE
jgi:hypothetical protein